MVFSNLDKTLALLHRLSQVPDPAKFEILLVTGDE